jgi:chromate transporter
MRDNPLWALVAVFVPFSLVSIGGAPSIFAGMQHQSVEIYRWVTAREFVELFAIARAAPGPGSMLATLLGWKVAGWTGAAVATLAFFVPSSLLCYGVAKAWKHYKGRHWHTALESGLAPIGAGLILAGVLAILRIAGSGASSWGIAGISAAILAWRPRLNPLLVLLGGAVAYAALRAGS